MSEEKSVFDAKGVWEGCLGEVERRFCKTKQELLMGDAKNRKKLLGNDKFKKNAPPKVLKLTQKPNPESVTKCIESSEEKKKSAGKKEDSSKQSCVILHVVFSFVNVLT